MSVIASNINDKQIYPLERKRMSAASVNYNQRFSSANQNKTFREPLKASISNKQIAFKGSPVEKFLKGSDSILGKYLLEGNGKSGEDAIKGILYYYPNPEKNTLVYSIKAGAEKIYKIRGKDVSILDEGVRASMPIWDNLKKGITDLPMFFVNTTRGFFDGEFKKSQAEKKEKIKARDHLLGLWMHIKKHADEFEKAVSGDNRKKLKEILKDENFNKDALVQFFAEQKLGKFYFKRNDSYEGLLSKGKLIKAFRKVVTEDKSLEGFKAKYVRYAVNKTIVDKEGSHLPRFSNSSVQVVARIITGIIPAWFIANDFYNLKIQNSDKKDKAKDEWSSKFKQESSRVGIEAYQSYIINSTFERLVNKSLPASVILNISSIASSNVLSRLFTGRPILPVDVNAAVKLREEHENKKAHKASAPAFGANSGGIMSGIRNYFKKLDKQFAAACPAKMPIKEFEEAYMKVRELEKNDARKMLKIVVIEMGLTVDKSERLNLQHIKEAAAKKSGKDKDKVIVGTNWVYRYSKNLLNFVKLPFEIVGDLGRFALNIGRKIIGKTPVTKQKESCFYPELFVKNIIKWANDAHSTHKNNLDEAKKMYGGNKNFFGPKIMSYGTDKLSTAMKLTGFTTVPFLAVDAYNVTLGETQDKDNSREQTKQRILQDSTRQGVSYWITNGFNKLFKAFSNASLYGSAGVLGVQALVYESVTRKLVGQPLVPVSHEKMVEIESKRSKSKNWIVKAMCSKIKTADNVKQSSLAVQSLKPASLPGLNTELKFANNSQVSDLYKQFSGSLN